MRGKSRFAAGIIAASIFDPGMTRAWTTLRLRPSVHCGQKKDCKEEMGNDSKWGVLAGKHGSNCGLL